MTAIDLGRAPLPGSYTAIGYRAAEVARKSGRPLPQEASSDTHLLNDRELLGNIAEDMDRSNGIYECAINRSIESILGRTGLELVPDTGDDDLNATIKRDWRAWGRRPEVTGRFSWQQCEELALRAHYNRGDVGVVITNRRKIQYITSPRIAGGRRSELASRDGGRVVQGVELDGLGAPLAYWVCPRDRSGRVQRSRARRVKAEDFILYANRKDFDQTRGVPVLASIFSMVHRLGDILDSEAIAWQNLARFAVAINREGGPAKGYQESKADDDGRDLGTDQATGGDLADRVVELDEGIIFHGEIGETIRGIERNLPGANFGDAVRIFFALIGAPFGVPGSILLLDFRGLTYTANRAEIEQAAKAFYRRFRDLKDHHHSPIYEAFVRWGVEDGRYPDDPSTYAHGWRGSAPAWIDRLKESQAWKQAIEGGMATQSEAIGSAGSYVDHESWLEDRVKEIKRARERAAELNEGADEGDRVDWRHLAGIPVSKQQSAPAAGADPEGDA